MANEMNVEELRQWLLDQPRPNWNADHEERIQALERKLEKHLKSTDLHFIPRDNE